VLTAPGKGLAMNFNLIAFNKAAKRMSAEQGITVAAAQEKLAGFMGFPNYDAAQKRLRGTKQVDVADSDRQVATWKGLGFEPAFAFITTSIFPRVELRSSWDIRAAGLLRMVMADVFERNAGCEVTTDAISEAMELEAIEERAFGVGRHQGDVGGQHWAHRAIESYLTSMSGYSRTKFKDQNEATSDQHRYLLAHIQPLLPELDALAMPTQAQAGEALPAIAVTLFPNGPRGCQVLDVAAVPLPKTGATTVHFYASAAPVCEELARIRAWQREHYGEDDESEILPADDAAAVRTLWERLPEYNG
jgi:hypothetical protein